MTSYEQTMLARLGPVSILHHFKGTIDENFLRRRITEIIQSNLYLAGRLIRSTNENNKGDMILQVPKTVEHIDWHLKIYRSEKNPFHGLTCGEIRTWVFQRK